MKPVRRWARRFAQRLWAEFLVRGGFLRWADRRLRDEGAVIVMAFHRVLDDRACRRTASLPGMVVRERTFQAMAACLARRCRPVDAVTVRPGVASERLQIAATFDDGWQDNAATMLPLAEKHGIPVTVFLCTGVCGRTAPFWPERVSARMKADGAAGQEIQAAIGRLKRIGPEEREQALAEYATAPTVPEEDRTLSWEDAGRMQRMGARFGAHTRTHTILPGMTEDAARNEIAGSKEDLEGALNVPCDAFAYPDGQSTPEVRQWVAAAGFSHAFTTEPGAWTADRDRLAIPRVCVWEGSLTGLRGTFSPVMFQYAVVWRAWRATARMRRASVVNLGKIPCTQ